MTEAIAKRSLEKEYPDLIIWNVRDLADGFVFMATKKGEIPQLVMDPFYKVSKDDGDIINYTPMMEDDPSSFFDAKVKIYKELPSKNKKDDQNEENEILHGINMDVKMSYLF